jgi:hypothetical protein
LTHKTKKAAKLKNRRRKDCPSGGLSVGGYSAPSLPKEMHGTESK